MSGTSASSPGAPGGAAPTSSHCGTLSDAMSKYPKAFDKLYVNMINAGEAGGVLDLILARLADFMEKAQKLKKKVIGAMIYPIVVISIAVGIVSMIMIFVIPKFEQIFVDFGTKLPTVTVVLSHETSRAVVVASVVGSRSSTIGVWPLGVRAGMGRRSSLAARSSSPVMVSSGEITVVPTGGVIAADDVYAMTTPLAPE